MKALVGWKASPKSDESDVKHYVLTWMRNGQGQPSESHDRTPEKDAGGYQAHSTFDVLPGDVVSVGIYPTDSGWMRGPVSRKEFTVPGPTSKVPMEPVGTLTITYEG